MSMYERPWSARQRKIGGFFLVAAAALLAAAAVAGETPDLGEPVSAERIHALDFTVLPDGTGLPEGSGDARLGLEVYQRECRLCHGDGGQGGPNDRLVGGQGSLDGGKPVKTVGSFWPYATTVFDYIRRAMPHQAPGSLSADEVYGLTAYLLAENGIIAAGAVMDARTLPAVEMPNRTGFVWAVPEH